jgi:hypothetical protein
MQEEGLRPLASDGAGPAKRQSEPPPDISIGADFHAIRVAHRTPWLPDRAAVSMDSEKYA